MITDPEADIRHGTKIGRFVVVGELGKGGMGVVYSAHDRELDRKVALKVMRSAQATDEERVRMLREGQAMARITHPNVITVYEVGVEGSLVFLAQELLDGGTLGDWLQRKRPHAEIVDKFVAAGRGLAAAHAAGLVHRDFKPDNVLLGKDGRVRVADFGLARALGPDDEGLPAATRANMARARLDLAVSPMSPLTRTGAVMGTPMFMAPEQHEGAPADERSDQFAFSVALYQALYGAWPFPGQTAVALADAVIEGRLQKPPKGHGVPERLRRILLRGLATRREDRYPSMDALLADLTRPPGHKLRTFAIVASVGVVIAGAVVGGYVLRTRDEHTGRATFDPKMLTNERDIAWLTQAIDRGQLGDAADKYEMAAALAQQNGEPARASIARSAEALVLALGGKLAQARTHLREADAAKGTDATAIAYADLAAAAVAHAGGDLPGAIAHATRCARELAKTSPELSAMCDELHGEAASDKGDVAGARSAYADGLATAKRTHDATRETSLTLALASLDLDEGKYDDVATVAADQQAQAAARGASSPETHAWILLARAHVALGDTQKAYADLDHVKSDTIEPFQLQIEHRIAFGQVHALLEAPEAGLPKLDEARTQAEQRGYVGLALAARFARLYVLNATSDPDVAAEQAALIHDARAKGYGRIAHLAETVASR
ncbi:MAG: serine/threonine-protein kinase [Acidobacteriota bacterium]